MTRFWNDRGRQRDALYAATYTILSYASYYLLAGTAHILNYQGPVSQLLIKWDSGWYIKIIQHGYTYPASNGQASWAFFPLYPICVWITKELTHLNVAQAGILFSNLCLAGTIYITLRYLTRTRNPQTAQIAALLLAFGPYSFYFSTLYTESLSLLLIAAGLYALTADRWIEAGLTTALLTATHSTGVLFGLVLLIAYYRDYQSRNIPHTRMVPELLREPDRLLAAGLVPLGLTTYMLFLNAYIGDALAFIHVQRAWFKQFMGPIHAILNGLAGNGFSGGSTSIYLAIWAIVALLAVAYLAYESYYGESIFLAGTILIPLNYGIMSIPRFTVGSLVFTFAAASLLTRTRDYKWILLSLLITMNAALTLLWFTKQLFLV